MFICKECYFKFFFCFVFVFCFFFIFWFTDCKEHDIHQSSDHKIHYVFLNKNFNVSFQLFNFKIKRKFKKKKKIKRTKRKKKQKRID